MVLPNNLCDREMEKFYADSEGQTTVRVGQSPVYTQDAIYRFNPLLNGASKEMNVNGSVTPVDFTFAPGAGEVWYIEKVSLTIEDKGKMDANAFGSIPGALAQGVLLTIQSKGTSYDICTLSDNLDISNTFIGGSTPTSTGWFDTDDAFIGSLVFNHARMILQGDSSDFVRMRIRDDLTTIDFLRSTILIWRVI